MADPLGFIEPRESLDPADDEWSPDELIRTPAVEAGSAGAAALADAALGANTWGPRAALYGAAVAVELAMRSVACLPAERTASGVLRLAADAVVVARRRLADQAPGQTTRLQHELRMAQRDIAQPASWLAAAALVLVLIEPEPDVRPRPARRFANCLNLAGCAAAVCRMSPEGDPDGPSSEFLHEFVHHWSATFRRRLAFCRALSGSFSAGDPPTLGFGPATDDGPPAPDMIALPGAVMQFPDDEGTLRLTSGRRIDRARLRASE